MAFALANGSGRSNAPLDSATFAHVAERFRRAGDLHRAVALCREGLKRFPSHVSARVTLGLSLLDLAQYSQARAELQQALKRAPDNLAAIRGLAQLHDHPDDTSHLDDDEDLRAQNHWRSLSPRRETSEDGEPFVPGAFAPEPVAPVQATEHVVESEAAAPGLYSASVEDIREPPGQFEQFASETETFYSAPALAADVSIEGDPSMSREEPAPRNWTFDPDLAAYEAALPLSLAPQVAPVQYEIEEAEPEQSTPFAFAPVQTAEPSRRTDVVAAAFERLLTQVNNQRVVSA
jgi:hypothetical protein